MSDRGLPASLLPSFDNLYRDLRLGLRSLSKAPGFAAVAMLVIAVGISANTAVFSVVDTVLLKPIPYPDPQSLMHLMNTGPEGSFPGANVPKFNVWRQQSSIFQYVAAYDQGGPGVNLTGGGEPEQVQAFHVSADYFRLLGAPIVAGRTFTEAEDSPHGGNVAVLNYGLWKRRFGGNPNVVGTSIHIDGEAYQVVGVVGRGFHTEAPCDLFVPYQFDLNSQDMAHYFGVMARLKPGITVPTANAQLKLAGDQYRRLYPGALGPDEGFSVTPLQETMVGDSRNSLLVLMGAVGLVLLIACANVANLLLIRATARKRELATRSALGAGRLHIIRQLLTESLLISLSGGVVGLVLGVVGVRLLLAVSSGNIPRVGEDGSGVTVDLNVLFFTFAVSVLTGILFGLAPAISASRKNLAAALNESSNRSGVGFRSGKLRSVLVVAEMALALVLVIGATLLIRTFMKLQAVDPGFQTRNVVTMSMSIGADRFRTTDGVAQMVRDATERLDAVPGVVAAASTCCMPMQNGFGLPFEIVGRPKGDDSSAGGAGYHIVSWGYFDAFNVPILRGRRFTERDNSAAPGVVIINDAMARKFWAKDDPLTDRLLIGAGMGPDFAEPPRQIIGVVGDMHTGNLNTPAFPTMFVPVAQIPDKVTALNSRVAPLWWVVRTQTDPHGLYQTLAARLRDASGGLPVAHMRTMDEIVANSTSRERFNMLLLTIFGLSALLMAAIGIYGLMAYSVQQRTQELGVRMALGAPAVSIRNMVVRQGMVLAGLGVVAGVLGALWLTHFLASLLFGVKAIDLAAFLITPVLLSAVALLAVWVPAQRATRVSPIEALRVE